MHRFEIDSARLNGLERILGLWLQYHYAGRPVPSQLLAETRLALPGTTMLIETMINGGQNDAA